MKKLASTIASIWRLSIPYFRSDDRWADRALLGAVIVIELFTRGDPNHPQQMVLAEGAKSPLPR